MCFGAVSAGEPRSSRGITYSFERNSRPFATSYLLLRFFDAPAATPDVPATSSSTGEPRRGSSDEWPPFPTAWPTLRGSGSPLFRSDLAASENPRVPRGCAEAAPSARFRSGEDFLLVGVVRCVGGADHTLGAYDAELRRLGYRRVNSGLRWRSYERPDVGMTLLAASRGNATYVLVGVSIVT